LNRLNRLAVVILLVFAGLMVTRAQTPAPTPLPPAASVPSVSVPSSTPPSPVAAVPVHEVPSPAGPEHLPAQIVWALAATQAMEYLKKSKWFSFLTPETSTTIQARIGFFVALATAAGIHFAISGSVLNDQGVQITLTGLSINAIKDVIFQWSSQQAAYRAFVKEAPAVTIK
jgi:hypothetical protein